MMKLLTLARLALKNIRNDEYRFDSDERKSEAIRQMRAIITGYTYIRNHDLPDPLKEFHIKVYVPNYDYPFVQLDHNGDPYVWNEDGDYSIPGYGSHQFVGIGESGEEYYLSYLETLLPYRNLPIKVDKYTDLNRAAHALLCNMTSVLNKKKLKTYIENEYPLPMKYMEYKHNWKNQIKNDESFEKEQQKLYVKWLMKWITIHRKNPQTHMVYLKNSKKTLDLNINTNK